MYLLAVDDLMAPKVIGDPAYMPEEYFTLEGATGADARFTGFRVTVATSQPDRVRVLLNRGATGLSSEFEKFEPSDEEIEAAASIPPRPFSESVEDVLAAGQGVYWLLDDGNESTILEHQFAVLVPEALVAADSRVQLFTTMADDETPLGSADFTLAPDFFYMAVIGDSIQWGQGLREPDKMSALVAAEIEARTGRHVVLQRYAISGSVILPADGDSICTLNCSGEVPTATTSITVQADLIERPDLMELIMLDGCINDVGVGTILDPMIELDALATMTQQFCETEMTTLLRKVTAIAPNAAIVVTGYFQIVGPDSDILGLQFYAQTEGLDDAAVAIDDLAEQMSENSVIFNEGSQSGLATAVATVNAELDAHRIGLAIADFGPQNAVFAPEAWLFGTTADNELAEFLGLDLDLFPEDPIAGYRAERCFDPETTFELISCLYVALGHPNETGERAYAVAVIDQLAELGVVPDVSDPE